MGFMVRGMKSAMQETWVPSLGQEDPLIHGAVGNVIRHRRELVILHLTLVCQWGLRGGEAREGCFLELIFRALCKTA